MLKQEKYADLLAQKMGSKSKIKTTLDNENTTNIGKNMNQKTK